MSKFEDARTMAIERYAKLKIKFVDPKFPLTKIAEGIMQRRLAEHFISGGLLYKHMTAPKSCTLLCVPDVYDSAGVNHRKRIFDESHGTYSQGHRGVKTTRDVMRSKFFWPNWWNDVALMIKACEKCQVSKIDRRKPQGLMNPVAQPLNIAQHYNIDFVGPIPRSCNGNHCMMIVVDRFSRRLFLYPTSKGVLCGGPRKCTLHF